MMLAEKAETLDHQLIHRAVRPSSTVKINEDTTAFQALRAEKARMCLSSICFQISENNENG